MASMIVLLGFVAATVTSVAFFPQVLKTWKTKSARDISKWMFLIIILSNILWIAYGAALRDIPIIATNVAIFTMASAMLYFKAKYK